MRHSPHVTLGMPVHNGERYIRQAIDSVRSQTFEDFELVIADNASTDSTEAICREYVRTDSRIRYHRQARNLGAAQNFNFVFNQCRSPYFKWMAHDDLIEPTYLARCLDCFERGPESLVLCYARRRLISPEGRPTFESSEGSTSRVTEGVKPGPSFRQLLKCQPDQFPMYVFGLIRTDALQRTRLIGRYPSADLVLVAEMRLLGPFGEVPEALFVQRRHAPDHAWQARRSKSGEAQWYNPNATPGRQISSWHLFKEHVRGIATCPIDPWAKLTAYAAMASYFSARIQRLCRNGSLAKRLKEELTFSAEARLY